MLNNLTKLYGGTAEANEVSDTDNPKDIPNIESIEDDQPPEQPDSCATLEQSGPEVSQDTDWPEHFSQLQSPAMVLQTIYGRNFDYNMLSQAGLRGLCTSPHSNNSAVKVEELTLENYRSPNLSFDGSSSSGAPLSRTQLWPSFTKLAGKSTEKAPKECLALGHKTAKDRGEYVSSVGSQRTFPCLHWESKASKISEQVSGGENRTHLSDSHTICPSTCMLQSQVSSASGFHQLFMRNSLKGKGVAFKSEENYYAASPAQTIERPNTYRKLASNLSHVVRGKSDSVCLSGGGGVVSSGHEGIVLREWLKPRRQRINKVQRMLLFKQILDLVDDCHSQGLALQHLRPSYFLVLPLNQVKYLGSFIRQGQTKMSASLVQDVHRPEHILKRTLYMEEDAGAHEMLKKKHQKISDGNSITYPEKDDYRKKDQVEENEDDTFVHSDSDFRTWNIPYKIGGISLGTTSQQSVSELVKLEEGWYASPGELGDHVFSFPSNIYSLGVLFFEVEKAFREGAARQNAHCIFVCLALKLLEERLHIACKEIVTLEKQTKLLEEEEKEKREEEERKERKKTKEREKKLRRKERLKEKDKERERKHAESKSVHEPPNSSGFLFSAYEKLSIIPHSPDSVTELTSILESTDSSDFKDEQYSDATPRIIYTIEQRSDFDGKYHLNSGKFSTSEYSKSMWRKLRNRNDDLLDQTPNWHGRRRCYIDRAGNNQQDEVDIRLCSFRGTNTLYKPSRERFVKHNNRSCVLKSNEKFHSSHARVEHRFDHQPCCSNQQDDYFEKDGYHNSVTRTVMEIQSTDRTERTIHMPRSFFCIVKHSSGCYSPEVLAISKGKHVGDSPGKEIQKKQVWEPLDAQKKFSNSKPDSKITSVCVTRVDLCKDISIDSGENGCQQTTKLESADGLDKVDSMNTGVVHKAQDNSDKFGFGTNVDCHNKLDLLEKSEYYSKNDIKEALTPNKITCSDLVRSSSSSDNCFSCLSEGDISTSSSAQNADSSVTSDSEDASQLSCGRDASSCNNGPFKKFVDEFPGCKDKTNLDASFAESATGFPFESYVECDFSGGSSVSSLDPNNKKFAYAVAPPLKHAIPLTNNNIHVPFIPPPTLCYHARNMDPWSASCNGFMPFSQVNYYVLPNHLGYGLPANRPLDFNMHYNNVQHVNVPVFDPSKQLFHQTSYNMNIGNLKDHEKHPNPCGFPPLHSSTEPTGSQSFHEKSYSDKLFPNPAGQNHNAEHYANAHNDHSSFSLFHFGGPVAGATTGSRTQLHSLKDEANRGFAYKLAAAQSSPKEEIKVEEYCLFSARNDARFSFF